MSQSSRPCSRAGGGCSGLGGWVASQHRSNPQTLACVCVWTWPKTTSGSLGEELADPRVNIVFDTEDLTRWDRPGLPASRYEQNESVAQTLWRNQFGPSAPSANLQVSADGSLWIFGSGTFVEVRSSIRRRTIQPPRPARYGLCDRSHLSRGRVPKFL